MKENNNKPVTPADILRIAGVAEPKRKIAIGETRKVGPWTIRFDPPPIPHRCFDWQYVHDDYDGAPDSRDNRHGECASFEACLGEIIELQADEITDLKKMSSEGAEERKAMTEEPKEKRCEFVGERRGAIERCNYIASDWSSGRALCGRHKNWRPLEAVAKSENDEIREHLIKAANRLSSKPVSPDGRLVDYLDWITSRYGEMLDQLFNHCPIGECSECAKIVCPHGDPFHLHHDGCPACAVK